MFGGGDGIIEYAARYDRGGEKHEDGKDDDPLEGADEAVLLRHLGFANDTEVTDDELRLALQQKLDEAGDNDQLAQFYLRMHERFFPGEGDEQGGGGGEEEEEDEQQQEEAGDDEGFEEEVEAAAGDGGGGESDEEEASPPPPAKRVRVSEPVVRDFFKEPLTAQEASSIPRTETRLIPTSVYDYQRGTVTPLERRVVHRTVQLDSQSRDPRQLLATSYLFDLKEKLHHVVKVSVFAVTVPYHWYTVGAAFGSNFFFLAPTAPGVAGVEQYTVQVKVAPGNYSAAGLADTVQTAITALPTAYPRLAFYGTALTFDANAGTATLRVDLQNTFEDPFWVARLSSRSYDTAAAAAAELFVPPTRTTTETDDLDMIARRGRSLGAYLGFNRPQYATSCAYSLPLSTAIEAATTKLTITSANQTLKFVHYLPANTTSLAAAASLAGTGVPDYVTDVGHVGTTVEVKVPLGVYTQQTLMMAVNEAMAADGRLEMAELPAETAAGETFDATATHQLPFSGSYLAFERVRDQTTVTTGGTANHEQYGQMRFVWCVRLRRDSTRDMRTEPRGKLVLQLPTVTVAGVAVWVGDPQGMNFPSAQLELQTLRAETPLLSSNYKVAATTSMTFQVDSKTLKPAAKSAGGGSVSTSTSAGYSLEGYLAAINAVLPRNSETSETGFAINAASINPSTGYFLLDVDFARDYAGSTDYQFLCNSSADYFFSNFRITSVGHSLDASTEPIQLDGTFQNVGSYDMTKATTLFRLAAASGGSVECIHVETDGAQVAGPVSVPFVGDSGAYLLLDLLQAMRDSLALFTDADGARLLATSSLTFTVSQDGSTVAVRFLLAVVKRVTEADLTLTLTAPRLVEGNRDIWENTSWSTYLKLPALSQDAALTQTYALGVNATSVPTTGARRLSGTQSIQSDVLVLARDTPWTFPAGDDVGGVLAPDSPLVGVVAPPQIVVPAGEYNRQGLITKMNELLAAHPDLVGSAVRAVPVLGVAYCELRICVCRSFGPESHELLLYSPDRFASCVNKTEADYATANVVPTQTLGWILGFHTLTRYGPLDAAAMSSAASSSSSFFFRDTTSPYAFSVAADGRGLATITGGATVTVNPYATLYLTLDDFSQNRANDTVVSIAARDSQYSQIGGSTRRSFQCDPATGRPYVSGTSAARMQTLTRNALYANTALLNGAAVDAEVLRLSTSTNPATVPTDTLAVLPLGAGAGFGQSFTWQLPAGDGAAAMTRRYTGPIKFGRGRLQLLTDRGAPLVLNGQNWSVTLLCELLASPALP